MSQTLFRNEKALQRAFSDIAKNNVKSYVGDIIDLILGSQMNKESLQLVLVKYGFSGTHELKNELLDLLISYANVILSDEIIADDEQHNFKLLKLYFGIEEGDFHTYKSAEIHKIITTELDKVYDDQYVTKTETIHNQFLQELFGLSYDQFDKMKETFVLKAMNQGAQIKNLDTANKDMYRRKS